MHSITCRFRGTNRRSRKKKLINWIEFSDDQARFRIEQEDGTVLTMCAQCRAAKAKCDPPEEPDCAVCWVDLMPENREAVEVYMMTRNQIITAGMGQIIDISIPAVCDVMNRYPGGIKDQWKCLSKVRMAFHYFLKEGSRES